jgi:alpha-amylase
MQLVSLAALMGLAAATGGVQAAADVSPAYQMPGTFVHLFEWSWNDIARECEDYLSPLGYAAVQVSPPNEHRQGSEWWTRYQPVSYDLNSRSGNITQFSSMVQRCSSVGVEIIVDAVVNHMASGSGVGTDGSSYGGRSYPGTYGSQDFHNNGNPTSNCGINNYTNRKEVQECDLVGLPDLNTGTTYVQERIAKYITDMYNLGVRGVRIDAAKHIDAGQLKSIMNRVPSNMYVFQEVIDGANEPIKPAEYFGIGDVTEFNFARNLRSVFASGSLADLRNFGEAWGLMPNDYAVTFIENHDTEREYAWNYKNGRAYEISVVYALAQPYGYPKVMSGYNFNNFDQGPPNTSAYDGCFSTWTCQVGF